MSESKKAVVRGYIETYNLGNWDQVDQFVSADYAHHNNDARLSLEQFKRGAVWFRAGMPDFHIVIEDMVAEGDYVVIRFTGHGTHLGSFYGETPTSKPVVVYGMTMFRVMDNRIVEDWEAMDEHDFMRQVGANAREG